MKALVVGSAGQLGRELLAQLGSECAWAGDLAEIDVTDAAAVGALVERVAPEVVFNATAWNRVDAAEAEARAAFAINALAPRWLASAAAEARALLVHVSTDYVFDGCARRPYREDDLPHPLSVYGASKLAGEALVAASAVEQIVVRTSGVIGRGGSAQKGGSFVDRIVAQARSGQRLRVVADQVFAPTVASDLARAAIALARSPTRGLVHVTGAGSCSWHQLATAALEAAGLDAPVERIALADLRLPARRPIYSVLDCSRYLALGLPAPRHWKDALTECVAGPRPID
ncbi:MAG TPA: dTDP-4-dehydrorhamnose reductase [Vicinamibacteria bacterium]|nr:dTDP-4-dehydrorhamnose reductase [Vicinamibacteria bacterium]